MNSSEYIEEAAEDAVSAEPGDVERVKLEASLLLFFSTVAAARAVEPARLQATSQSVPATGLISIVLSLLGAKVLSLILLVLSRSRSRCCNKGLSLLKLESTVTLAVVGSASCDERAASLPGGERVLPPSFCTRSRLEMKVLLNFVGDGVERKLLREAMTWSVKELSGLRLLSPSD